MPPLERQKLMNMKGTDQENIKKYVFKKWRDVYNYHEDPNNPDGWKDCFLQRKLSKSFSQGEFRENIDFCYVPRESIVRCFRGISNLK